jgi:hypothetical protein
VVATLPPNPSDPYRTRLAAWDALYRAEYDMRIPCAPAYVRSWGRLAAGLLQREPPAYVPELPDGTDPPIDVGDLSDLLDEGVKLSAGYGVVYIRPVFVRLGETDAGEWSWSLVSPLLVEPVWVNGRLAGATTWDVTLDPRKGPNNRRNYIAIVETWNTSAATVTAEVWEAQSARVSGGGSVYRLIKQIDSQATAANPDDPLRDHPYIVAANDTDESARRLIPVVWEWDAGMPAPMYAGNEAVVYGLIRLWDQEQDDAELTRKRVIVSEDLLAQDDVMGTGSLAGQRIARAGFGKRSNLLVLKAGMSAQSVKDGKLEVVDFGDDLVMRDRIERRESAALEAIGINPQSVGRSVTGRSDSAAAKRADQQLTMQTIAGPARAWEAALTDLVRMLATLRGATDQTAATLTVDVREGLKTQPMENAETARALAAAQAASTYRRVAVANPTWNDEQITEEVARMQAEGRSAAPLEM